MGLQSGEASSVAPLIGQITPRQHALGRIAKREKQTLNQNPASWVQDDGLWEKAKAAAQKSYNVDDDAYWPVVARIYENMGGAVGGSAKHIEMTESATVSGTKVDKSDFAYAPGDKASDWKLPIHDAAHVRAALARYNQADIPADAKPAAYKKILAAAKRFGVHVSADEPPDDGMIRLWEKLPFEALPEIDPDESQVVDRYPVLGLDGAQLKDDDGQPRFTTLSWVKYMPRDTKVVYEGEPLEFDDAFLGAIVRNFDGPLNADYDHQSDPSLVTDPKNKRSSGDVWLLEERADGVWALVHWTEEATRGIQKREWKRVSPEFSTNWTDKYTGEKVGPKARALGLVNRPFLEHDMPAVAAGENTFDRANPKMGNIPSRRVTMTTAPRASGSFRKLMAKHYDMPDGMTDAMARTLGKKHYGLDDDAMSSLDEMDDDAAMAAFQQHLAKNAPPVKKADDEMDDDEMDDAEMKKAKEAVSAANKMAEDARGQLAKLEQEKRIALKDAEHANDQLLKLSEDVKALKEANAKMVEERRQADAVKFCEDMHRARKMVPAQFEDVKAQYLANPDFTRKFFEKAPTQQITLEAVGHGEDAGAKPGELPDDATAEEKFNHAAEVKLSEMSKAGTKKKGRGGEVPMTFTDAASAVQSEQPELYRAMNEEIRARLKPQRMGRGR